MAIMGLDLEATEDYVFSGDPARGSEDATVWVLGTLDSRILGKIRDMATTMALDPLKPDEISQTINSREMDFTTVVYGLRGWRNFPDGKGGLIDFKTEQRTHNGTVYTVADPMVVKRIPPQVMRELAAKIRRDNTLDEALAGNSVA